MEPQGKESLAVSLERAKRDLQEKIEQAASEHSSSNGPFELEMDLAEENDRSITGKHNEALMDQIHTLVEVFHHHASVRDAGVTVQRVEVIDSDGDGKAAVNIMFDHIGYD